jgi:hypothetical protein
MIGNACINTDKKLWQEDDKDSYTPSIFVTDRGAIGIKVGGMAQIATLREWHRALELYRLFEDIARKKIGKHIRKDRGSHDQR